MQNKHQNQNSDNDQPTQSIGRGMYAIAWLFGLALLTLFFSGHEERKINPNKNPDSSMQNGVAEVVLQQNRQGHYVTNGTINGHEVVFLLDTGATDVSIPAHIADDIGLKRGRSMQVSTANGTIKVYQAWLQEVSIAEIVLTNVDANINPGIKDNFILLGMSALKHLEFTQRGRTLTLKTYQ
ncbi:MAG: TIGR02281 family clan AA aspartic protease [Gammaproteobacteria bacterium]|nr:TIGR02281 family clan AA aspartic protease [Gammaproteobacteria bacterium]